MIRLRRILSPTDFSASSDRAFDLALLLAQEFDAELHMFHAVVLHEEDPHNPAHHFPDPGAIHDRLVNLADSAMTRLAGREQATEARLQQITARGIAAAPTILEYAYEWDADLIVMGTEGRRGPSHLLLGSVAEEVVSHASCAVLTARAPEPAAPLGLIDRLLVPVDLSEHSRRSLETACDLARGRGAEVVALHVVEDVVYPSYFGQTIDVSRELLVRATEALDQLVSRTRGAEGVRQEVVVGQRAVPEIVRFVERNAVDMVVISTHGLGGIEEFLFGSTAKRLVQLCPAPVLALRAFGKSLLAEDS